MKPGRMLLIFLGLLFIMPLVTAVTFTVNNESTFNEGTYVRAFFNTTINQTQINQTVTNGTYVSKVFDAMSPANWTSIAQVVDPNSTVFFEDFEGFSVGQNIAGTNGWSFNDDGADGSFKGVTAPAGMNGSIAGKLTGSGTGSFSLGFQTLSTNFQGNLTLQYLWEKETLVTNLFEIRNATSGVTNYVSSNMNSNTFWRNANGPSTIDILSWALDFTHFYIFDLNLDTTLFDFYNVTGLVNASLRTKDDNGATGLNRFFWNAQVNGNITVDDVSVLERTNLGTFVRNCTLANCADGVWQDLSTLNETNLNLLSRYFQFRYNNSVSNIGSTFGVSSVILNADLVVIPPGVTGLIPANGTLFDIAAGNELEISAIVNAINSTVDTVFANITLPNGTIEQLTLFNLTNPVKFNNTFIFPELLGLYEVRIIANLTTGEVNDTEITIFEVFRDPLSINILLPLNGTNFTSTFNIELELNTSSALFPCKFTLDGGVTNTSISCTVPTSFNAPTTGTFILTAFASNASTEVSDTITFSINVPELNTGAAIGLFSVIFFYLLTSFMFLFLAFRFDEKFTPISIFFFGIGVIFLFVTFHSIIISLRDVFLISPVITLAELVFSVTLTLFVGLGMIGMIFFLVLTIREMRLRKLTKNQDDGWDIDMSKVKGHFGGVG